MKELKEIITNAPVVLPVMMLWAAYIGSGLAFSYGIVTAIIGAFIVGCFGCQMYATAKLHDIKQAEQDDEVQP